MWYYSTSNNAADWKFKVKTQNLRQLTYERKKNRENQNKKKMLQTVGTPNSAFNCQEEMLFSFTKPLWKLREKSQKEKRDAQITMTENIPKRESQELELLEYALQ